MLGTDLISQLNLSVPCRFTRNYIPLILNHFRSSYDLQEPFIVLCFDYNRLYPTISKSDSLPFHRIISNFCTSNYIFTFLRVYLANSCRATHESAPRSIGRVARKKKKKMLLFVVYLACVF